jgi:hypothetical protein
MNLYLFEYYEGKTVQPFQVRAANAWDAFDMFRAHKPDVTIAEAWFVPVGAQQNHVDAPANLAG